MTTVNQREIRLTTLPLAADARLSRTDYTDDQSWEFSIGTLDAPAMTLQTRYGGRVGLASLVPMWNLDGRTIYQAQTYTRPPTITAFAPGYVRADGGLTPFLTLTAEYWVMESHAVGARYTLANTGNQDVTLRLEIFGHVAAGGKPLKLAIVTLGDGKNALSMGEISGLRAAVMLENGTAQHAASGGKTSPKIGQELTVPAGGVVTVRWVHAGLEDLRDSLALAESWLARDWSGYFQQIASAAEAIPNIETGRADLDTVIAASYHALVQSLLKPSGTLPYASFVATRQSTHGYSPAGDGSDHDRGWSGQTPQLAYPVALALATIDGTLAQGIVLNYLAIQTPDGAVDAKPGMAGQRQGFASLPILARMAWGIFQITGDETFLREALPKLVRFFEYWTNQSSDRLPSWVDERQMGYLYFPTFGQGSQWAQNADVRTVIGSDMAAYLIAEAVCLSQIAQQLGETSVSEYAENQLMQLRTQRDALWDGQKYGYRDRETGAASQHIAILTEAHADQEHFIAQKLETPARLIVRVTGGTGKTPRMTLTIDGVDANGNKISETAAPPEVAWYRGYGVYTTQHVYAEVDRVQTDGLSRVYKLDLHTLDTTRTDINALLPLITDTPHAAALMKQATDAFLRPNGITMCAATDEDFDPSNQQGCGGIWPFWAAQISEGLWSHGYHAESIQLLSRLLSAQANALETDANFHEFYHSDTPKGLGEAGHLGGIAPLYLLPTVFGVMIVSRSRVWAGGAFKWNTPVTVRQHGITVTRSASGTRIAFRSGSVVELKADAPWQMVEDPEPVSIAPTLQVDAPPELHIEQPTSGKVLIQVEIERPKQAPNPPTT